MPDIRAIPADIWLAVIAFGSNLLIGAGLIFSLALAVDENGVARVSWALAANTGIFIWICFRYRWRFVGYLAAAALWSAVLIYQAPGGHWRFLVSFGTHALDALLLFHSPSIGWLVSAAVALRPRPK